MFLQRKTKKKKPKKRKKKDKKRKREDKPTNRFSDAFDFDLEQRRKKRKFENEMDEIEKMIEKKKENYPIEEIKDTSSERESDELFCFRKEKQENMKFIFIGRPKQIFPDSLLVFESIRKQINLDEYEIGLFLDFDTIKIQKNFNELEDIVFQIQKSCIQLGKFFTKKAYGAIPWDKNNASRIFFENGYEIPILPNFRYQTVCDYIFYDVMRFTSECLEKNKKKIVVIISNKIIYPKTFMELKNKLDKDFKLILICGTLDIKRKDMLNVADLVVDWFEFIGFPKDLLHIKTLKFEKIEIREKLRDYFKKKEVSRIRIDEILKNFHERFSIEHLKKAINNLRIFRMDLEYVYYNPNSL